MTERVERWDILKFFLMFLVVFGHAVEFYITESQLMSNIFLFIYSFHMPLFLFLSGLFSKRLINGKRYGKMAGYLVLYLLTKLIFAVLQFISSGKFSITLLSEKGLPWYMFVMFSFPIITVWLRKIKPQYVLITTVILAMIAGYDNNINDFLMLSRTFAFYPFYYLGYITDADRLQKVADKRYVKVLSALVLIGAVVLIALFGDTLDILIRMFTGRNPFTVLNEYRNWGWLARLCCIFASVVLSFAVISVIPKKTPLGLIAKMGKNTLAVYVLHYPVLHVLYKSCDFKVLLEQWFPDYTVLFILLFSLILTVLLSLSIFTKPLNLLMSLPQKAIRSDFKD